MAISCIFSVSAAGQTRLQKTRMTDNSQITVTTVIPDGNASGSAPAVITVADRPQYKSRTAECLYAVLHESEAPDKPLLAVTKARPGILRSCSHWQAMLSYGS